MGDQPSEKNYTIENSVANRHFKVLIADDNSMDRLIVSTTLMQMGFKQIVEAENGQIAQYKIENATQMKAPFDLIILDWEMPQVNGIRLLKIIRSDNQTKKTCVLMLTGTSNVDRVTEALESGVNQFVVKPINPKDFCQKISALLKLPKAK
jgi:two-component system chemotaxis response regulator CheY